EVEYGWIEPTALIRGHASVFGVRRFWEKPNKVLAQVLQMRGCLWNSFVMVASVRALLEIIQSATPNLYRAFACLNPLFSTEAEAKAVSKLYRHLEETNFSHRVLALLSERLAVLRVSGVRMERPRRTQTRAGIAPYGRCTATLDGIRRASVRVDLPSSPSPSLYPDRLPSNGAKPAPRIMACVYLSVSLSPVSSTSTLLSPT